MINLIVNRPLLPEDVIGRLSLNKICIFELPLLSVGRAIDGEMSG